VGFEDRPQDAHGGAQPEVRLVQQGAVAGEVDAAAAGAHVGSAQGAQLVRQHRLDAAAAGGEVAFQRQRSFPFARGRECRTMDTNVSHCKGFRA